MIRKNLSQNNIKETLTREEIKTKKEPFLVKHWVSFTIISAALIATATMMYLLLVKLEIEDTDSYITVTYVKRKQQPEFFSSMSHLPVANADLINQPVNAVMVENHPEARPQSGLKEAEIVFEAIAEGGITRFVGLYQVNQPQKIGPVRSLRKYYIDWTTPFNPSVAHVGGSTEALGIIRNGQHRDLDQIANGAYFWRAKDRYAPHNVYTTIKKLNQLNQNRKYLYSEVKAFDRQQEPDAKKRPLAKVNNISLNISSSQYKVDYKYDPETNSYQRNLAGKPHLDREAGQISPKVVVAMVNHLALDSDGYHNNIKTTGNGQAFIFQNGQVIKATWSKPNLESQISFTDEGGNAVTLNYGQVWITSVPNQANRVSWN